MSSHQSLSSNSSTQHQMQQPMSHPTNGFSSFPSSLQPGLLDQNMTGLNNGGLGSFGISDPGIQLGGITSGLGGGLTVNQGFDNSFNLEDSGTRAFGGLLETPSASSSTSTKLPGLDGLGGLFSNAGNSDLEGDHLNGRQPQWQPPNAPGMNSRQGNTNGIDVTASNDQPSWW